MDIITYYLDPGVEYKISMSLVLSSLSILKIYKTYRMTMNAKPVKNPIWRPIAKCTDRHI